ncbi:MAG: fumarylacetoacetate hydrolase family protein [Deltaproteobacteria bacterium]|nr:fumarylacetoacetate hydrolase family protein [Deltaproteobacteria bacterium]MBT4089362.1 fumarylacetoacetate hydrolase family protein [Deltaproteobacteria bacterium]MBT4269731.1 fumarylacetoacetate hydrolase family protein [Deltaproteobacteria bacterium]MBT4637476.1 fumarylacetoacetate hydrolase family protein [Deltaproteobacteria bacterium]MBT6502825.1 fumarylacetoacetate hydrolase family protein [Deltaproteobacteria bacterium]
MKIIRFINDQNTEVLGCDYQDGSANQLEGEIYGSLTDTGRRVPVKKLLSPVAPTNILCIGLNYYLHAKETGLELPIYPTLFMKNVASASHPNDPIEIPLCARKKPEVDYEIELAVVIGKSVKNVSVDDALDFVAGYTVANDVSARRWQGHAGNGQWVRGKSYDTFCPIGPCLVTPDEIADPQNLNLECRLNGEVMQQAHTSDMIFSVAQIISYLSEDTTLIPGTIILTGTPWGVGYTRNPPVYLKQGDLMELEIEKIGTLVNAVTEPKP